MREYGFPQYLNVNVLWLLPCRKCAKEFIELGCELSGEVALEVTREIDKMDITLPSLPRLGTGMGTCEAGN